MSMYGLHPKVKFDKEGREVSRERVRVRFDAPIIVGKHRDNPGKEMPGVSMTQQSAVGEADINAIIKRFGLEEALKLGASRSANGVYLDLVSSPDYKSALSVVAASNEAFAELSAAVRKRFSNDPAKFLEFMSDPSNIAEAVKLGLASEVAQPKVEAPAGGEGAQPPK